MSHISDSNRRCEIVTGGYDDDYDDNSCIINSFSLDPCHLVHFISHRIVLYDCIYAISTNQCRMSTILANQACHNDFLFCYYVWYALWVSFVFDIHKIKTDKKKREVNLLWFWLLMSIELILNATNRMNADHFCFLSTRKYK